MIRAGVAAVATAALAIGAGACGGDDGEENAETAASNCPAEARPTIDDEFPEPPVRSSEDGVLETTLRSTYGPVELDGKEYETMNYEGSVPGPTLSVCPGDRLLVDYENDLGDTPASWDAAVAPDAHEHGEGGGEGQLINLHTHGFHVSPEGDSDNVFLEQAPGEEETYEYEIPEDHPPGMLWYHPHRHGYSEPQVYAGMLGVIDMRGGLDEAPEIENIPTRTMVITSTQLGDGEVVPVQKSETEKSPYFLNGELEPDIPIQPGQVQRWRILNGNDNAIVNMRLDGHTFYVLANDGNTLTRVAPRKDLLIGPGERREVLVQGGARSTYELESLPFAQFQHGDLDGSTIATLTSAGEPADDELPLGKLPTDEWEDLRDAEVDQRHEIVYSEKEVAEGQFEFLINGKVFDPDRVDETMRLGEVNEWVIRNDSDEWHTFHIHVNDFQVTGYKAKAVPDVSIEDPRDVAAADIDPEDTVKIPPGGIVTMRTRPTDYTGEFVFHCHMLFHEDRGMMGTVTVTE
jgi:FtsP/CotA-like multicopper oxidase with cupredoxin domain